MFIRYWADTTGSQLSYYALEYMRSFMRVAPVRLISVTGILAGRWQAYSALLATPMAGPLYNVVCCDPSRWTWQERVPASSRPVVPVGDDEELTVPAVTETITGQIELHTTSAVRNVLFAVAPPRSAQQLATAKKYSAIVVPTEDAAKGWRTNGVAHLVSVIRPIDHDQHSRDTVADRQKQIKELFLP